MYLLKLSLRYSFYQPYWKTRFRIQRCIFKLRSKVFKGRASLFNSIQDAQIFWSLLKTISFSFFIALLIVMIILLLARVTGQVSQGNINTFDNLMIAITGVSGVFLGFYFSNLNTVIGNSYAKLPDRIRQLIIDEKVGNLSLRFVVFLNALALLTLATAIIGNIRSILSVYILSFLSAISIFVISFLLRRVFIFIDPTIFISLVIRDFLKWFNFSTNEGYLWKDSSFQNHYHSQARKTLRDLRILFDLALTSPELRDDRLYKVILNINALHEHYLQRKGLIPTDSRWFSLVPKHKDWYLADSHELDLATNTRTFLQPILRTDMDWVEKILIQMNYDALKALNNSESIISTILEGINDVIHIYGQFWLVGQAKEIVEQLEIIAFRRINLSEEDEHLEEKIVLLDYLGLIPISMFLGFTKKLSTINIDLLQDQIKAIDWIDPKHIYNLELPYPVLERLEFIQKRLWFERRIEGQIISPLWYITLLISQSLAFNVDNQLIVLFSLLKSHYIKIAEVLIHEKQFILAIQIISRGLEFTNKLSHHLNNIHETTQTFSQYKYIKTLPWPVIDWENYQTEIVERNNELLFLLSQCIPNYPKKKFSEDFPDYFGLAVHTSGEALYDAMESNNHLFFIKLFPNYFFGILEVHDRLLNRDSIGSPRDQLTVLSEPILDLIDLSGYAYIYSEYHQKPAIWTACKELWDQFLGSVDTVKMMNHIAGLIHHSKYLGAITPRSLTRTNWEIRLNQSLEKFPRKSTLVFSFHALLILDHPSRLIRVLGGTDNFGFNIHHATDVFIDLYLKSFPDSNGIDFGNRYDIRETMHRWQENEEMDQENEEQLDNS